MMAISQRLGRYSIRSSLVVVTCVAGTFGIMRLPGQRAATLANALKRGDQGEIIRVLPREERMELPLAFCPDQLGEQWSSQKYQERRTQFEVNVDPPTIWQFLTCRRYVVLTGAREGCDLEVSLVNANIGTIWQSADDYGGVQF